MRLFRLCSWPLRRHLSTEPSTLKAVLRNDGLSREQLLQYYRRHWDDTVSNDHPYVRSLFEGMQNGNRSSLATAITLVESRHPTKRAMGEHLLRCVLEKSTEKAQKSGPESLIFRVAITGSPGAGKSTFIETFGLYLINEMRKKIAVLTVDPSSVRTGGSIMGDVARMTELSRQDNCYIRPSATGGSLGGVRSGTHESVVFCEGCGYDVVLIETVGVGQSEVAVAGIADMVIMLLSPALGDELQGLKRGIMEDVDLLIVTKADGDLANAAALTCSHFKSALKYTKNRFKAWRPKVLTTSSVTKKGVPQIWEEMSNFRRALIDSGELTRQRNQQMVDWLWSHVDDVILDLFRSHPTVQRQVPRLIEQINQGHLTPVLAAEHLIRHFLQISQT